MIHNQSVIDGFFDFPGLYNQLAEEIPNHSNFAEIGVFRGASLIHLARRIKEFGKDVNIYAIDIWKQKRELNRFFCHCVEYGVSDMIKPLRGCSDLEMMIFPANYLWGCFIDGDHSYSQTKKDIEIALEKTSSTICGHDYQLKSVSKAVCDVIGKDHEVIGNCWLYRKS